MDTLQEHFNLSLYFSRLCQDPNLLFANPFFNEKSSLMTEKLGSPGGHNESIPS